MTSARWQDMGEALLRGLQYAAMRRIVCREDGLWLSCLRCLPAGGRRMGLVWLWERESDPAEIRLQTPC